MDRILAIDDNPQIQKLVTVNLQARGYAFKRPVLVKKP